jgi:5-amino-6-(5-phosphoribosylamino)uracil reductase
MTGTDLHALFTDGRRSVSPGPLTEDDLLALYAWPDQGTWLRANMVTTIDGLARGHDDRSDAISSASDKVVFRLLRHTADAVVVGAGTVTTENYGPMPVRDHWQQWRAEHGRAAEVPIVVVSNRASLAPDARVLSGPPGSALVAVPASADADRVKALRQITEVLVVGDDVVDVAALLAALADRGMTRVLTEGGPTLLAALMPHLDELCLTTTGLIAGGPPGSTRPVPDLLGGASIAMRRARLAHLVYADDALMASWLLTDR